MKEILGTLCKRLHIEAVTQSELKELKQMLVSELEAELELSIEKSRHITMEADQYKEQIKYAVLNFTVFSALANIFKILKFFYIPFAS